MQDGLYALPERIASKIEVAHDGCWMWTAAICRYGYGAVRVDGRTRRAHRYVYELLVGAIQDGREIHHVCEARACVNPAHMQPILPEDHRALSRGRPHDRARENRATCPHGHPYDAANTSVRRDGSYFCRTCHRERERRRRKRT